MVLLNVIAYEHAAALIGQTPLRVSRDPELLFQAHSQCHEQYQTIAAVLGIDVYNLEPEALGAEVDATSTHAVPVIVRHPCDSLDAIDHLPAIQLDRGRLDATRLAADQLARRYPHLDVGIPLAGPYAVASSLVGMEPILLTLAENPTRLRQTLLKLIEVLHPWHQAVAQSGHRAVIFESGVAPPLVSPSAFRDVIRPAIKQMLDTFSCSGATPAALVIGADTSPIVTNLVDLPLASIIAPRDTDQAAFIAAWQHRPDVHIRINMNSRAFAQSDWPPVEDEWHRAMQLAGDRPNLSIGTGVLPYEASPQLVKRLVQFASSKGKP